MSSLSVGFIVLVCLCAGAVLGFLIRRLLPEHHLNADSKDAIKIGTGLIGTMGALVLGLMVGSAKGSYDAQKAELTQMSAKIILLDRGLAHFGPETKEIREQLKLATGHMLELLWPEADSPPSLLSVAPTANEGMIDSILALSPKNDSQRSLKDQAMTLAVDIGQTRWLLNQQRGSSISAVLLILLVFWFSLTFVSTGLLAPVNGTVLVTLFLCAVSLAGAVFLVLEFDHPFSGMIQISSETLRHAVAQLGR
jgi:hypothetical protein